MRNKLYGGKNFPSQQLKRKFASHNYDSHFIKTMLEIQSSELKVKQTS